MTTRLVSLWDGQRPTDPHLWIPLGSGDRAGTSLTARTHNGDRTVAAYAPGTVNTAGMWLRPGVLTPNLTGDGTTYGATGNNCPRWLIANSTLATEVAAMMRMDNMPDDGGILAMADYEFTRTDPAPSSTAFLWQHAFTDGTNGEGSVTFFGLANTSTTLLRSARISPRLVAGGADGAIIFASYPGVPADYESIRLRVTHLLQRTGELAGTLHTRINAVSPQTTAITIPEGYGWPGSDDIVTTTQCAGICGGADGSNTDVVNRITASGAHGAEVNTLYFQRCEADVTAHLAAIHAAFLVNGQIPFNILRSI